MLADAAAQRRVRNKLDWRLLPVLSIVRGSFIYPFIYPHLPTIANADVFGELPGPNEHRKRQASAYINVLSYLSLIIGSQDCRFDHRPASEGKGI